MAKAPSGSQRLSQHQPQHQPHSYQPSAEVRREADKLLEELSQRVAKLKGITVEEARAELRHWV